MNKNKKDEMYSYLKNKTTKLKDKIVKQTKTNTEGSNPTQR